MSLVLAACKDKDDSPIPKKEGRRTVLIYQSAQNSLGYDSMHRKDSIELVAAKNSTTPTTCINTTHQKAAL